MREYHAAARQTDTYHGGGSGHRARLGAGLRGRGGRGDRHRPRSGAAGRSGRAGPAQHGAGCDRPRHDRARRRRGRGAGRAFQLRGRGGERLVAGLHRTGLGFQLSRTELGYQPDDIVIGCFGRVRAQKGVDLLVESALRLFPDRPRAKLVFTGRVTQDNQQFFDDLQARIAAAGLSDRIRFLGEIPWDQVVRTYQALDLFAAPARWEGFGQTPLEAMASETAVVASDAGAYAEMIAPGETGAVTPAGNYEALRDTIRPYLADPQMTARHAAEGLASVRRTFALENEAKAVNAVYESLK